MQDAILRFSYIGTGLLQVLHIQRRLLLVGLLLRVTTDRQIDFKRPRLRLTVYPNQDGHRNQNLQRKNRRRRQPPENLPRLSLRRYQRRPCRSTDPHGNRTPRLRALAAAAMQAGDHNTPPLTILAPPLGTARCDRIGQFTNGRFEQPRRRRAPWRTQTPPQLRQNRFRNGIRGANRDRRNRNRVALTRQKFAV